MVPRQSQCHHYCIQVEKFNYALVSNTFIGIILIFLLIRPHTITNTRVVLILSPYVSSACISVFIYATKLNLLPKSPLRVLHFITQVIDV